MEVREHRSSFIVHTVLEILVVFVGVMALLRGNYENAFLCLLTLLLLLVPAFIQMEFKIELPTTLEIIILLFIFAAEILGEIFRFYLIFPFWDTMLHTMNGFLAAAVGFSLINLLNRDKNLEFHLSPVFVCLVAFCFSMTIGVLWEFCEFSMDKYLGKDTQKDTIVHEIRSVDLNPEGKNVPYVIENITTTTVNGQPLEIDGYLDIGLIDTMEDLWVNFLGAAAFCFAGYFYLANDQKKNRTMVARFVPTAKAAEADYKTRMLHPEKQAAEDIRG